MKTQVVNPFKIAKEPVEVSEKPNTLAKQHLMETQKSVDAFLNYEQKFEEKFSLAQAIAVVWQTSGRDLKNQIDTLIPLMEGNKILKQQLLTVVELINENLHLLEKTGIALKTIDFYTARSEVVSRQAQTVLGDMIDSLTFEVGLESLATVQQEMQVIAEKAANAESQSNPPQTLVFSGQALSTMTALNALKEELNRVQTALGLGTILKAHQQKSQTQKR